jgi:hypothetical protein
MLTTTDREVRDFIADKAAELAVVTKSDRIYVSCYCMMFGTSSVKKEWTISVGNMAVCHQGESFDDAVAAWRATMAPESKLKRAEQLRAEAAALEAEANNWTADYGPNAPLNSVDCRP